MVPDDIGFDIWNSCERKKFYAKRQAAKLALGELRGKGHLNLVAYKCRHCEGWHVGGNQSPVVIGALKMLGIQKGKSA